MSHFCRDVIWYNNGKMYLLIPFIKIRKNKGEHCNEKLSGI